MTPRLWENETRPTSATNAPRPLTHPLDLTEKGAAAMVRPPKTEKCSGPTCDRSATKRGYCDPHYRRFMKFGDPRFGVPLRTSPGTHEVCSLDECERAHYGRGLCQAHWKRQYDTGSARAAEPVRRYLAPGDVETFWRRVIKSDGCWQWTGYHNPLGYGYAYDPRLDRKRKNSAAHIIAYELTYGPVPAGKELDHFACDNPGCCNPDHVRPVTDRENSLRSDGASARNLAKTHCLRGHPFSGANLQVTAKGNRVCRRCMYLRTRANRAKRKAATA